MNQVDRAGSSAIVYFPDVLLCSKPKGNSAPDLSPALGELLKSSIVQWLTFPSFPLLPTEIRQIIWIFTFTSRTLQIRMHQGLTPAIGSDSATQPWTLDCPLKMACFCFTALEGLIESLPPVQYLSSQRTNGTTPIVTVGLLPPQ
jgi:hypothetical protein